MEYEFPDRSLVSRRLHERCVENINEKGCLTDKFLRDEELKSSCKITPIVNMVRQDGVEFSGLIRHCDYDCDNWNDVDAIRGNPSPKTSIQIYLL